MLRKKIHFILAALLYLPITSLTGAVIQLDDADTTFQVSDYEFSYYDATDKEIDIKTLIRSPRLFTPVTNQEYFGFGKKFEYWFKIKIWNVTPENRWVLFLSNPNTELLEIYYLDEHKKLQNKRSGAIINANEKEIESPFSGFYLSGQANKPVEYYIKLRDSKSLIIPFYIASLKQFFTINKILNSITGIVIGMMALLFFFNLGMFLGTRQPIFLSYIGFIFFLDLILLHELGVLSTFIGYWNLWYFKSMPIAMPLFLIAFLFFAKHLTMTTRENKGRWNIWMGFVLLQIPMFILATIISNSDAYILSWGNSNITSVFILIITGRFAIKENNLAAKIAFVAWFANFALLNSIFLSTMNILPVEPVATFYTFLFFASENIIMSWVLVIWWNEEKNTHRRTLTELHKYRFRVLQNRMHPHFLFNSLNIIYSMIDAEFTKKASTSIMSLAEIYRYLTEDAFEELIPLKKEITFLQKYLSFTEETLGKKISYTVKIKDDIEHIPIPPMCIQPLIENCIKHGMKNNATLEVKVVVKKHEDGAKVIVRDNGKGLQGENKANTLSNIKERISMHYKKTIFTIEKNKDGGVTIQLAFKGLKNRLEIRP
ncbi:MAG: histidine kinase [Leptospirales bacterium]